MTNQTFESSLELKTFFKQHYREWKRKHQANYQELAKRCGVSAAYLGQIARYGRVPGKPVLLLLALNFQLKDPEELLSAAGQSEPWPFPPTLGLAASSQHAQSFLNISVDMNGFTDHIRQIVREESKPRTMKDLTSGAPIRFGLSPHQSWLFLDPEHPEELIDLETGFFPELIKMLELSLSVPIEVTVMDRINLSSALKNGDIDFYGPVVSVPNLMHEALLTTPFCHIGLSGLQRMTKAKGLKSIDKLQGIDDLASNDCKIAVRKNSRGHFFLNTRVGKDDKDLILCETTEEGIERVIFGNIKNIAHVLICDSGTAMSYAELHDKTTQLVFGDRKNNLKMSDNVIAVRRDWPEAVQLINDAFEYFSRTGSLQQRYDQFVKTDFNGLVQLL